MAVEVVRNKKVVLRHHVTEFLKESDMEVVATEGIPLRVPEDSSGVLVKNLYLSCDPYMRIRMSKHEEASYLPDFVPGSGSLIRRVGPSRIFHDSVRVGSTRADWYESYAQIVQARLSRTNSNSS